METEAKFRAEVVAEMRDLQDEICAALEEVEREQGSDARFVEDAWERAGGGGGRSRVLAGGKVFEKAGVNFSEVQGAFSEKFAAEMPGDARDFFATGVSLVIHPLNPRVPTTHANFRHIAQGERAWFGGGADLTPYYDEAEDREHFHRVLREACEAHSEVADYDEFSKWCDYYFYLPHREECRGAGGIFYDDVSIRDADGALDEARARAVLAFSKAAGRSFVPAYVPIVRRRMNEATNEAERDWQLHRRGRYVEFNLLYDRGTRFGLQTGGRIESILMSLPPLTRWSYGHAPEPGSAEAKLLDMVRRPRPEMQRKERW